MTKHNKSKVLAFELKVIYQELRLFALRRTDKTGKKRREWEEVESRSISRVLSRTAIPLGRTSLYASSDLPESNAGRANGFLFGLAPSGVYLATHCCQPCGALLPHLFTLTGAVALRRLFSVALSVGSRLPGVTWHSALWSGLSSHRAIARQRLSNRLSADKVSGSRREEQAQLFPWRCKAC